MKKILLSFGLIILTIGCYCQDDCSKALEFKDIIKIHKTGNTRQDILNWFISQNGREVTSSNGWDADIGFVYNGQPVSLGGGSNSGDYEKISKAINTGNESVFNHKFEDYVYKQILKPEAYNVWIECIKEKRKTQIELESLKNTREIELGKQKTNIALAKIKSEKKGLIGEISNETEESFILKLKWQPALGVNTVKIKAPIVTGATYNKNALDLNDEIGSESISIPFYKIKNSIVSLTINTVGGRFGSFDTTLKATTKSYFKEFTFKGTSKYNDRANKPNNVDYAILKGNYTYSTTVSLTKNILSDKIENSTITGTINIKITEVGFAKEVKEFQAGGTNKQSVITKDEQAYIDANANTEYIITFKANDSKIEYSSTPVFHKCNYKIIECTQILKNGNKNSDCQGTIKVYLSYDGIKLNGDEIPFEIGVDIKNLAFFAVKSKL